jgi:hypothetical protein
MTEGTLVSSEYEITQGSSDDNGGVTILQLYYAYGGYSNHTFNTNTLIYINGTHCDAIAASDGVSYTIGTLHNLLVYHTDHTSCNFPRRVVPTFIAGIVLLVLSLPLFLKFFLLLKQSRDLRREVTSQLLWPEDFNKESSFNQCCDAYCGCGCGCGCNCLRCPI